MNTRIDRESMDRASRSARTAREDQRGVEDEPRVVDEPGVEDERGVREAGSAALDTRNDSVRLDSLFAPEASAEYRSRWNEVQSAFVDDPRRAVQRGDELVAQVMESLQQSFAVQREELAGELGHSGEASTESLRIILRRYRSFFERLLSA